VKYISSRSRECTYLEIWKLARILASGSEPVGDAAVEHVLLR
jgi:hypothetical protein